MKSEIINSVLRQKGPLSGKDLRDLIIEQLAIKEDAAKKRISRAFSQKKIRRTKISIDRRHYVYFLPEHHKKLVNVVIQKDLKKGRPGFYRVLNLIKYVSEKEGCPVSEDEVLKVSAIREDKFLRQTFSSYLKKIKKDLKEFNMIYQNGFLYHDTQNIGEIPFHILKRGENNLENTYLISLEIMDWLHSAGFLGYTMGFIERGCIKNDRGGVVFDGYGLSYINSLIRYPVNERKPKPSPIFIDVVVHRDYTSADVLGFKERIKKATTIKKLQDETDNTVIHDNFTKKTFQIRHQAFCFVRSCDKKVKKLAISNGFVIIIISNLFGQHIYKVLNKVRIAFKTGNINQIQELLEYLDRTGQVNIGNLMGQLFRYIISHLYTTLSYKVSIEEHGIDLIARKYDDRHQLIELNLIECKGSKKDHLIDLRYSRLEKNIKNILIQLSNSDFSGEINPSTKIGIIIVTSSHLDQEAKTYIHQKKAEFRSYDFDVINREELLEIIKDLNIKEARLIIQKYF